MYTCIYVRNHKLKIQPSASSSGEELDELIGGHVKESIQIDTPEAELLKRPLLWLSCSHLCFDFRLTKKEKYI